MPKITLPDGSLRQFDQPVSVADVAADIGPGLAKAALAGRAPDDPVILLAHRPDTFLAASDLGVDLTLSGHTHGGQIRILGWTPFKHSRYGFWLGSHERGGSRLLVSRGAGVTTLPLRVGSPAEVPLVRILTPRPGGGE